ncbi:hypothetical protein CBS9595_003311 [Malassezia furfur]|nr:hypothetical protein CBS9595_003311 [Malassezia furfur]
MQQAKSTKWSPGRMYALWTFMTVSMFSSVFLIKSYNRTRKREYIASKIQEEGVSPIESLLQNLSRQWDKKS